MARTDSGSIEVVFSGCRALVSQRGDGRWTVRWREARKGRSTTLVSREGAMAKAREIVRSLAGTQGGKVMSGEEVELLTRLKRIAGDRHPGGLLSLMEDVVQRSGDLRTLERAVRFWEQSGMADVERVSVRFARGRFLDLYEAKARLTRAGLRKELDGFCVAFPDLDVCDLSVEILGPWILRPKASGVAIGARFANNRLDSWRTFLNKCRGWNYWPKGEKHPAELVERQREPQRMPPIWQVEQVSRALAVVEARHLPYLALGCFAGLRPFELTRLRWEMIDWDRGYIHVPPEVALKTRQERFVPLEGRLRELLWPVRETVGKCCLVHDREEISILLRQAGVIDSWPQDVMRHSYISYRIARGDGAGLVAEHSGNSERIIRRHYRRPLRMEDGRAWFAD